jgi:calcineurin-like phosphoesterase family protein
MATHFLADPHLFHESIIRMLPQTRPFFDAAGRPDVRLMTQTIAASWRKVVRPGDDVIVVGDFAHRADPAELRKLFDSLPGRKHLVVGNHDGKDTLALPWESIRDIAHVSVDGQRVVICHYPMISWNGSRNGKAIQLYGHHHGRLPGNQQSCDVGVDVFGFAPVRLNVIKAHMATLPPRVDPEGGDDLESDGVKP